MKGNPEPRVSILLPAYNAEATLHETLQSALASSFSDFELMIVDDGSTDGTLAIAEEFAASDERVQVIRTAHRGVSAALNFGLAQGHGEFVARLDADDLWHPTKLEKQVALLSTDPALVFAYTHVRYVDAAGRIVRDAAPQDIAGRALCQCLYDGIVGGGSSVLFRRSLLGIDVGYDDRLGVWEDLLLHLHLAAAGGFGSVPEYLTAYRLRDLSSSADRTNSLRNWRLAARLVDAEFPQIPKSVRSWSNARRLLELAEACALDRRYARSALLLAESLAADPVRTSTLLAYRTGRRLSGRRGPLRQNGPLFVEADVKATYCLSRFDAGLEGDRLHALDEERRHVLRSIDATLPLQTRACEGKTRPAAAGS